MSTTLTHQSSAELQRARADLTSVRATLAERELALADLRVELKAFEVRYLTQVGVLYADLDDWEARIAEHEVRLYDSEAARERANQARRRAHETREAAYGEPEPDLGEPSPDLRKLFREVARRVHPDRAKDPAEYDDCTRLMARANKAYARGDTEALQRLLDDVLETSDDGYAADLAVELLRICRQIAHFLRDIAAAEVELSSLPTNEIAQLKIDADGAALEGRDLLAELAATLRDRITEAQYRHAFLQRQLNAYGR
jgi:hypothetical protein